MAATRAIFSGLVQGLMSRTLFGKDGRLRCREPNPAPTERTDYTSQAERVLILTPKNIPMFYRLAMSVVNSVEPTKIATCGSPSHSGSGDSLPGPGLGKRLGNDVLIDAMTPQAFRHCLHLIRFEPRQIFSQPLSDVGPD